MTEPSGGSPIHERDDRPAGVDRLVVGRHAAGIATSPPAVEATLASISDEVMEEAIARRNRAPAPPSLKRG